MSGNLEGKEEFLQGEASAHLQAPLLPELAEMPEDSRRPGHFHAVTLGRQQTRISGHSGFTQIEEWCLDKKPKLGFNNSSACIWPRRPGGCPYGTPGCK